MSYTSEKLQLLLQTVSPSREALLLWLQDKVNDQLLRVIAAADYGEKSSEIYSMLLPIRDQLQVPAPLNGNLGEVLQLTMWSEPDNLQRKSGIPGREGHLIRAFSCAVLLIAGADPANRYYAESEDSTLIQLVTSALALGLDTSVAALQLLIWRIFLLPERAEVKEAKGRGQEELKALLLAKGTPEIRPFYALAVLLLATTLYHTEEAGLLLRELGEWMIEEEDAEENEEDRQQYKRDIAYTYYRWLLDLALHGASQKEGAWVEAGRKILLNPTEPHPASANENLRLIGTMLQPR